MAELVLANGSLRLLRIAAFHEDSLDKGDRYGVDADCDGMVDDCCGVDADCCGMVDDIGVVGD